MPRIEERKSSEHHQKGAGRTQALKQLQGTTVAPVTSHEKPLKTLHYRSDLKWEADLKRAATESACPYGNHHEIAKYKIKGIGFSLAAMAGYCRANKDKALCANPS